MLKASKSMHHMLSWWNSVDGVETASLVLKWVGAIAAIGILILTHRSTALKEIEKQASDRAVAEEKLAAAEAARALEAKHLKEINEAKESAAVATEAARKAAIDSLEAAKSKESIEGKK